MGLTLRDLMLVSPELALVVLALAIVLLDLVLERKRFVLIFLRHAEAAAQFAIVAARDEVQMASGDIQCELLSRCCRIQLFDL